MDTAIRGWIEDHNFELLIGLVGLGIISLKLVKHRLLKDADLSRGFFGFYVVNSLLVTKRLYLGTPAMPIGWLLPLWVARLSIAMALVLQIYLWAMNIT